jgi:hypothetical protein
MINPNDFARMFVLNEPKEGDNNNLVRFATIDPQYVSGRPQVIYDIDVANGTLSKPLPHLASYTPVANDRVMILQGVILDKII